MEHTDRESATPEGWEDRWSLLWRVRVSAFYHAKRERFLDGVDRATKGASALGGAAAFASLMSHPTMGMVAAAIITLVSLLSLVYDPATKARRHAELARDFKRLEADIVACGNSLESAQVAAFEARLAQLESGEPASLGALVTQCHNELAVALGRPELVTPLPCLHRIFKNWFDFDQSVTAT